MSGLEMSGLAVDRGGFSIIREVDLVAPRGEVTVLLGPNGAGKTTLLEAISGIIPARGGEIRCAGAPITHASRVKRSRTGLGHIEQGRAVFGELTVIENVLVGAKSRRKAEDAVAMFPELAPRIDTEVRSLSGGEQQMVVIARALAAEPTALLVDEMSLGLAPIIVRRLMPIWRRFADEGMAVLLVEQFAALALEIGDRAYVLNRGRIVLERPAKELLGQSDDLRRAYLGGDEVIEAAEEVAGGHLPNTQVGDHPAT